jgi:hypothetical protein
MRVPGFYNARETEHESSDCRNFQILTEMPFSVAPSVAPVRRYRSDTLISHSK